MKYLLLSLLVSLGAFAKRVAPPEIKPIQVKDIAYKTYIESVRQGNRLSEMNVFIDSFRGKKLIWRRQIYSVPYNKELETDVQQIHPKSFKLEKDILIVEDERGTIHKVSAKTGQMVDRSYIFVHPARGL